LANMLTAETTRPATRPFDEDHGSRLRLQTSVRLRWIALAGQLIAVIVVAFELNYDLPLAACLMLIAMSAWLNVYLRIRFPPIHRLSPPLATALFAYDILQLGALLFLTGGIENPFMLLVVAPVTVSAATLPPGNTIFLGLLALAVTAVLSIVHHPLPWADPGGLALPPVYKLGIFASVFCCLTFLAFYAWRLSKEARQMSTALAATELVLAREQRLHALDGLAAAAAHELGTPLATIVLVASELEKEYGGRGDAVLAEDLGLLKSQATRCREILQKLTRAPDERDPMHASMTPAQIADEAAEPYRARGKTVQIAIGERAAQLPAPVAERRPGVLFGVGNLIENAVHFADTSVEIVIDWDDRDVFLTIEDDGPGFPAAVLEHFGEPYVSARPRRTGPPNDAGGLGLGMFIAKMLLERSGAVVEPSNKPAPAHGAVVRIVWPRASFEEGAPQQV